MDGPSATADKNPTANGGEAGPATAGPDPSKGQQPDHAEQVNVQLHVNKHESEIRTSGTPGQLVARRQPARSKQQASSVKSYLITNVSPKKRLHHACIAGPRGVLSDQGGADATGIELHPAGEGDESPGEELAHRDTSKVGVIGATTYKNILKMDKRDTNESIVMRAKLPAGVVGVKKDQKQAGNEQLTKIPKFSYVELSEWWKQHKNSLEKEEKDMPPICYESKSLFDMISYTANMPHSSDARQWKETLNDYKSGLREQRQFGYQYGLGTFPIMFKQIERQVPNGKKGAAAIKKAEYNVESALDGGENPNVTSNPALSNKTGEQTELSQKKASMQTLLSGKNAAGPTINVDEQIETGTTNIQIKDSDFKKEYTRPQTRGDTTGKPTAYSMNSSQRDLRSRKGLHQKNLSTQLSQNAKMSMDHQFSLNMKNATIYGAGGGMHDSGEMYARPGARDFRARNSRKPDAGKEYGADFRPIHVPRKFARRHARGASFNSAGKGLNDRDEDLPSAHRQVNSLIYDKATLEAEKEKERLRQQKDAHFKQQNEPLLTNNEQDQLREGQLIERITAQTSSQRPNTKQVTFRTANADRAHPRSRAWLIGQQGRPAGMHLTQVALSEDKYVQNERSHDQTQSGTLSQQPSQAPLGHDYGVGPGQYNQRQRRPKTNSNTLSSFGCFEFLPGGYSESYVRAFNDKIKISELFEQNRLTQKIVDGRKRKNLNSDPDPYRRSSNHTPSYMIQPNAFFSEVSATQARSPAQEGQQQTNPRVSADNCNEVTPALFAEEPSPIAPGKLFKPIIPPNSAKLFEHHTYQRDRYMDNYYNRLDKHAKSIDRTEQMFLEKLVIKDRILQKQLSLYENYGKKQFNPPQYYQVAQYQMSNSHNGPFSSTVMGYARNTRYPLTTEALLPMNSSGHGAVGQRNGLIKTSQTQRQHDSSRKEGYGMDSYLSSNENNNRRGVVASQVIEKVSHSVNDQQNTLPSSINQTNEPGSGMQVGSPRHDDSDEKKL